MGHKCLFHWASFHFLYLSVFVARISRRFLSYLTYHLHHGQGVVIFHMHNCSSFLVGLPCFFLDIFPSSFSSITNVCFVLILFICIFILTLLDLSLLLRRAFSRCSKRGDFQALAVHGLPLQSKGSGLRASVTAAHALSRCSAPALGCKGFSSCSAQA